MPAKGIKAKLQKNNYRLTQQREVVLDVMTAHQGQHLTADEVYLFAKEKMPNIGIATVYRTLERLATIGVLYKSVFEPGRYRYELYDDTSWGTAFILAFPIIMESHST